MFSFFLRNLSSSWVRTVSIVLTTFLSGCVGIIFYLVYINIASGIVYYTLDGIDERRFSITGGNNVFQLFDREKGGIPETITAKMRADTEIERFREFRFIDISVLGKFELFKFSLDIDVPTFSIRESSGAIDGIGISSKMLKYYNLEFAGSHVFFPVFAEADVIGRGVTLIFGASKVFSLPEKSENAYGSTITHVDADYPGFGVVISYEVAEQEMRKLGYTQNTPYKIVGYMKTLESRSAIEARYRNYNIRFDADMITEQKHILDTIARFLTSIMVSILTILYGFLFLLFMGYLREKEYVFSLIRQYKIEGMNRYILIFFEPILLILIGFISLSVFWMLIQPYLLGILQVLFQSKNVFFPLLTVSYSHIVFIGLMSSSILTLLLISSYLVKKR